MRKSRVIKGSEAVLEARRILAGSKAFIVLADDGTGNARLFSCGYSNEQVGHMLAKVLIGLRLKTREKPAESQEASEAELQGAEQQETLTPQFGTPHLYAPAEPPPPFAPDGRQESDAASDG